jgi:hypothetical protein
MLPFLLRSMAREKILGALNREQYKPCAGVLATSMPLRPLRGSGMLAVRVLAIRWCWGNRRFARVQWLREFPDTDSNLGFSLLLVIVQSLQNEHHAPFQIRQ